MPVDVKRIEKPVRKLRKLLKNTPKRPTPDEIHSLRTNTRRLEATIGALGLNSKGNERKLLRELAPIRRRAGKIRDMDVLTADVADVRLDGERDCQVQVLEHLGAQRDRHARK